MRFLIALILLAASFAASAAPRADKISWTDGGKTFDGYLVWDDSSKALRPGIVMVPNWYGVNEHAVAKAKTLAGKDYVILLVDIYGRGLRPANAEEAGKAASATGADPALRSHIKAALATLRAAGGKAPVDSRRIGAIGFCFGGMVAGAQRRRHRRCRQLPRHADNACPGAGGRVQGARTGDEWGR